MPKLYTGTGIAGKYQLDKKGLINIAKTLGYSCAAALITSLISIIPNIDFPTQYIWLVPVINSLLVALKKFIEE